jgi:tetratricopeptide (TPR) repeat protein
MTRRDALLALAIALAAYLVHQGVLANGFVRLDDATYVSSNRMVRQGLSAEGVRWAFSTLLMSNYHPLTWLSHMLDVQLFGLEPRGHHATSLLLHVSNALLVFWVFRRATGEPVASAVVAGLFAIHPTHVESVAWISERKDVLSSTFGLLAMGVYVGAKESPGRGRIAAVTGLFALSLLAKPMLVTLPAALLLLDYWPLRRLSTARDLGARVVEKWPLWALSAASCAVAIAAQQHALQLVDAGPVARVANAIVSYGRYLALTFWPTDLSVPYPHPSRGGVAPPLWQVTLLGVGLALATAVFVRTRSRPYLAFGWLWFGGMLVPVIGLLQVGFQAMADRYLYVPSLGLYVMLAWGGRDLGQRLFATRPHLARALALAAAAWALALAALAVQQVSVWRDTETLFQRSLAVAPGAFVLHRNLGNEYYAQERIDEAIDQYRRAVAIAPDWMPAHKALIGALIEAGDHRGAMRALRDLLARHPDRIAERNHLAHLLRVTGDIDEAIAEYRTIATARPDSAAAQRNLGGALLEAGETAEAAQALERALALEPDHEAARALLERARAG